MSTYDTHTTRKVWLKASLLAWFGTVAFLPIIAKPSNKINFISYDDNLNFIENDHIHHLSIENVRWAFSSSNSTILHVWEPVALVTKMAIASSFGFSASTFARFGVFCHISTTVIGFLIWCRVFKLIFHEHPAMRNRIESCIFSTSLMFAVHPLNVEAVRWISANGYTLATLLELFSLNLFIDWLLKPVTLRTVLSLMMAWLLHVGAIFTKPSAIGAGIVPLAIGSLLCNNSNLKQKDVKLDLTTSRMLQGAIPFALLSASTVPIILGASAVGRPVAIEEGIVDCPFEHSELGWDKEGAIDSYNELRMHQRLLRASLAVWFYLFKILFPPPLLKYFIPARYAEPNWRYFVPLNVHWQNPVYTSAFAALFFLLLVMVSGLCQLIARTDWPEAPGRAFFQVSLRCNSHALFASFVTFGCFLAVVSPTLEIVGQHTPFLGSDRYAYIAFSLVVVPALAVAIASATQSASGLMSQISTPRSTLKPIVVVGIVIYALLVKSSHGAGLKWDSSEAFWRYTVVQDKTKANVMNLATELINQHSSANCTACLGEAMNLFKDLSDRHPEDLNIQMSLASALSVANRLDETLALYVTLAETIRSAPSCYISLQHQILSNYALTLSTMGRFDQAIQIYKEILEMKPDSANERFGLANVYRASNMDALAAQEYAYIVNEIDENHSPSWVNRGNILKKSRDGKKKALYCYKKAVAADPTNALAMSQLGMTLQQLGQGSEAVQTLRNAVFLDPLHANTWFKLAFALTSENQISDAKFAYEKVVEIDPQRIDARQNLGEILQESGYLQDAIEQYRAILTIKPSTAEVLLNLAVALRSAGEEVAAKDAFKRAVSIEPKYRSTNFLGPEITPEQHAD